jgi:hypothetical protein
LLFENRHTREQGERSALDPVGRLEEDLAVAHKKSAGRAAADVFRERNRSIVEGQVEAGPMN